jgi:hypothetical protein
MDQDKPDEAGDEAPPPDAEERAADERAERDDGNDKDEKRRSRLEGLIPDLVRRTIYAGLGAVFTTEEGIRRIASDLKLPKDVANYLIQQASSSKDELFRIVAKELRGFLESLNVSGELQKLLTSLSFEIRTEIRFIPNSEAVAGVKPDVKFAKMSVKRTKDKRKAGEEEE